MKRPDCEASWQHRQYLLALNRICCYAVDGSYQVNFATPQQAVGVVAEPNLFDLFDITLEAFDAGSASLGSFTLSSQGEAEAAFLGLRAEAASIASIRLTSEPDAAGFAFCDLTYGLADPAPPIALFVHGYGASFADVGFELLLDDLRAKYGIERVPVFQHYQDAGYRDGAGSCDAQAPSAILPQEPNDGMPVDFDSIDPDLCDSWADLALNALMLEADIQERCHSSGAQVVLIANNMGAAIVRGMLSY
jgi:hypothetical protein